MSYSVESGFIYQSTPLNKHVLEYVGANKDVKILGLGFFLVDQRFAVVNWHFRGGNQLYTIDDKVTSVSADSEYYLKGSVLKKVVNLNVLSSGLPTGKVINNHVSNLFENGVFWIKSDPYGRRGLYVEQRGYPKSVYSLAPIQRVSADGKYFVSNGSTYKIAANPKSGSYFLANDLPSNVNWIEY